MIYLEHDFISNFSGSLQYGDLDFANDMLVNEFSDMIVYTPDKVIDMLVACDIEATKKWSDEQLLNAILNNFGENVKLQRGLTFMVGEQNQLIDNKTPEQTKKRLNNLGRGLVPTVEKIVFNPNRKKIFSTNVLRDISFKASTVNGRNRVIKTPKKKNYKWIFLLILGGSAFLIWKYRKKIFADWNIDNQAEVSTEATTTAATSVSDGASQEAKMGSGGEAAASQEQIKLEFAGLDGDKTIPNINADG